MALLLAVVLVQEEGQIRTWIAQLGAATVGERDEAARRLLRAGAAAVASLERAARSGDLEAAARAREILREMRWSRHFLPHEVAAKAAAARGLDAAPAAVRPNLVGSATTPRAPIGLLRRYADDPDPAVRTAVLWAALRCPQRSAAPLVIRLLEQSDGNREALFTLVKTPEFFGLLDERVAGDLKRLAEGARPETRLVARLALAHRSEGGLAAAAISLPPGDQWFPNLLMEYAGLHGRAADAAVIEGLLGRPGLNPEIVIATIVQIGGPEARRILTRRLQAAAETGASDDMDLMIAAGHADAPEAIPSILKLLDRGINIGGALHALSDLEVYGAVPRILEAVSEQPGDDRISISYLASMGGPTLAASAYRALRRRHEGETLSPIEESLLPMIEELNVADQSAECIRGLDPAAPPAFREHCLKTLSGALLPRPEDARRALGRILRTPEDPLWRAAAAAAADLGTTWDPAWPIPPVFAAEEPAAEGLELMGRLRVPTSTARVRASLTSTQADRKLAAIRSMGLLGTPEEVRRLVTDHSGEQAYACLQAAVASGDGAAIATALDTIPRRLRLQEHLPALDLIAPLAHDAVEGVLARMIDQGTPEARLAAAHALHRRRPGAVPEPARLWIRLASPWDLYFAADERRAKPRADLLACLHTVLDPDHSGPVTRTPAEDETDAQTPPHEVTGALRSLGRLGDTDSRPVLVRYLREGAPDMAGEAAHALVDLLGPTEALPLLRGAARDAADEAPILRAMAHAGDRDALRTLVSRLRTRDNHYATDLAALNALDAAVHADAYERGRPARTFPKETLQWGRLLQRLEARTGVRLALSPGLNRLNLYYDRVTIAESHHLLTALEISPEKWDANVAHVHRGDHILLCTPVEARELWVQALK